MRETKKGFTGDFSGSFMKNNNADQVNASDYNTSASASRRGNNKTGFKLVKQNTQEDGLD